TISRTVWRRLPARRTRADQPPPAGAEPRRSPIGSVHPLRKGGWVVDAPPGNASLPADDSRLGRLPVPRAVRPARPASRTVAGAFGAPKSPEGPRRCGPRSGAAGASLDSEPFRLPPGEPLLARRVGPVGPVPCAADGRPRVGHLRCGGELRLLRPDARGRAPDGMRGPRLRAHRRHLPPPDAPHPPPPHG